MAREWRGGARMGGEEVEALHYFGRTSLNVREESSALVSYGILGLKREGEEQLIERDA
jgi:hypothetical protein